MVQNLGDFFNAMPVISGISKALNESVRLIVSPKLRAINGFREFMEFQDCIGECFFRDEIINMNEEGYTTLHYSREEFRNLKERPNRPIETMRHERWIHDSYKTFNWEVDDDFKFMVYPTYMASDMPLYVVGDRWLNNDTDTRRSSFILKDSGVFDDPKYHFLDYTNTLMNNAYLIVACQEFYGTFTGSGMLADLLGVPNYCVYCDDMVNPPWNNAPIEYSYWKHYYADRPNQLIHIEDLRKKLNDSSN